MAFLWKPSSLPSRDWTTTGRPRLQRHLKADRPNGLHTHNSPRSSDRVAPRSEDIEDGGTGAGLRLLGMGAPASCPRRSDDRQGVRPHGATPDEPDWAAVLVDSLAAVHLSHRFDCV